MVWLKLLMSKLVKFYNLHKQEQKLLVQAYLLLNLIRLGLFFLPFQRLKKLLEDLSRFQKQVNSPITARFIARAIHYSARLSPGKVMCLAKALTTNTLMNIYDLPCQLNIGVAKSENNHLEAHAWVEVEGRVIVGYLSDLSRFQVMQKKEENQLL